MNVLFATGCIVQQAFFSNKILDFDGSKDMD